MFQNAHYVSHYFKMNRQLIFSFTIFIALTTVTILLSCNTGQKTKILDRWGNGKNKVVLTYDNPDDTLTYLREYFHENGQLGSRGHFLNNKQEGFWEWWFDNGKKQDEATLRQDAYVGQRKHWRKDGTLDKIEIISGACLDQCCDGKEVFYTEKGIKLIEYTRQNGERNGEGILYYPDGKIKRKFIYANGKKNGMCYDFYPNGKIDNEVNYIDDKEEGLFIWRDSTGKITTKTFFKNGQKNGMSYEYQPNGQILNEGNYVDDKEEGKWAFRDSTGKVEGYKFFKNGEIVSTKEVRAK